MNFEREYAKAPGGAVKWRRHAKFMRDTVGSILRDVSARQVLNGFGICLNCRHLAALSAGQRVQLNTFRLYYEPVCEKIAHCNTLGLLTLFLRTVLQEAATRQELSTAQQRASDLSSSVHKVHTLPASRAGLKGFPASHSHPQAPCTCMSQKPAYVAGGSGSSALAAGGGGGGGAGDSRGGACHGSGPPAGGAAPHRPPGRVPPCKPPGAAAGSRTSPGGFAADHDVPWIYLVASTFFHAGYEQA